MTHHAATTVCARSRHRFSAGGSISSDVAESGTHAGPGDLTTSEKVQAFAEADGKAKSAPLLQRYEHIVIEARLGAVRVLDVRTKHWKDKARSLSTRTVVPT